MTNEEAKMFLDNLKICIDEHPVVADWLVEIADRKTEPQIEYCPRCGMRILVDKTEPTISKMEQVADEPQTEEWHDDCDTCMWYDGACTIPCCDYEPKDEPQTYITEDRDTQILDAWQVHHRNTTSVEDEPQTDCAWK